MVLVHACFGIKTLKLADSSLRMSSNHRYLSHPAHHASETQTPAGKPQQSAALIPMQLRDLCCAQALLEKSLQLFLLLPVALIT